MAKVCSVIAKSGNPNLAHSGVARNGKGVCSVIAKSGIKLLVYGPRQKANA